MVIKNYKKNLRNRFSIGNQKKLKKEFAAILVFCRGAVLDTQVGKISEFIIVLNNIGRGFLLLPIWNSIFDCL